MWEVKALLPRGRHGEGFSFHEISRLFYHLADMVRVFLYGRSQGSYTKWQTWCGLFLWWYLNTLLPRGRHGEDISLREISRLFYHVADMVRVFLYVISQGLFYHVADMVRVFLHFISRGSSTTWQTWWGFFFTWDLKALLPHGRHGEGFSSCEISMLFYHVADMVRVFLYGISQGLFYPCSRHGENFSVCQISRLFYHVADMVRAFLYVRS